MSAQPNGGAAFPVPMFTRKADGQPMTPGDFLEGGNGMSLRDWFAGMALQGMAPITVEAAAKSRRCPEETKKLLADACYGVADAMLAAREGKEGA